MTKTKSDPITHQMPPRHAATANFTLMVDDIDKRGPLTHAERRRARKIWAIAAKDRQISAAGAVTINGRQVGQFYPAGGGPVPPLNPSGPNGSRRRGRNASNRHFAARLVGQALNRRMEDLAEGRGR